MSAFQPGWYELDFNATTRDVRCGYFKTATTLTAECLVQSSGHQTLLWLDSSGLNGNGRPSVWSPHFRRLTPAATTDWWNEPPGGATFRPLLPIAGPRATRAPTPREFCQRVGTAAANEGILSCTREIHVGLFFDGTNNNMVRDMPTNSHSNIVALHNVHVNDRVEGFRYYMPGVGTKFPQIGENSESGGGKAFASGGEARIHWAMLQVFNALHRSVTDDDLLDEQEMLTLTTSAMHGLRTSWRLGDGKMIAIFGGLQNRLIKAIEGKRPRITAVRLSVFGFSRGAAEARTFCQWIRKATGMKVGNATLDLRFLGIFDTVASVGVADSMPIAKGLMDWADGTMDIENVGKVVHYVAAHEIRQSFPLSTARIGAKAYPSNTNEFIYPGAHSDLGGGYGPGDQGKSVSGRSALLSQIALNDMYFEARNAGVKLLPKDKMLPEARVDFDIAPELDNAFNAYCDWTRFVEKESVSAGNGPPCENRMQYHMQLYWRWRAQVSPDSKFKGLSSYRNSSAQDKTDLWESELDWRKDVARAQEASKPRRVFNPRIGYVDLPPPADAVQRQIVAEVNAASSVPAAVSEFFDKFVHDSHGGFWLLGPITKDDRAVFIAEVRKKKAMHDKLMESAEKSGNPGYANNMRRRALAYELNAFERRVLEANKKTPGGVPLMTDADAADLRAIAGTSTEAVLAVMGTATRREPKGHGRYRRVFDS
ncbi:phospholipase effector Tle1 domain-containing protein [Cupriavidus sp. SS-3]|uniref:phospholipase effector Tle1 domain-containing protein n=1 Tax=Cupriavidus sp. SS-3 TaxID=3109596 RepID=UPI002DB87559|nr:DUF2235 domain-containing protein [Cupriavidus sp. SS-3]MEC3767393.1 DUF2235 domain-containing protein [Cupriavidus sp. SS-3]